MKNGGVATLLAHDNTVTIQHEVLAVELVEETDVLLVVVVVAVVDMYK